MLSQINFSQVVDLGFVALVSFVCIKNIFGNSADAASRRAEAVRGDLRELESALRGLIGEASAASGNLDKSLNRRKAELELLLNRIENKTETSDEVFAPIPPGPASSIPASRAAGSRGYKNSSVAAEDQGEDQLPNDTWVLGHSEESSSGAVAESLRSLIESSEDSVTLSSEFEQFALKKHQQQKKAASAASAVTAVTKKAEASKPVEIKSAKPKASLGSSLAQRLAQAKTEQQAEYIPSFIEPGAFRVAKRLLMSGQEIHVVARKLDLPLGDVRVIERLARGDWEETEGDAGGSERLTG